MLIRPTLAAEYSHVVTDRVLSIWCSRIPEKICKTARALAVIVLLALLRKSLSFYWKVDKC